MSPSAPDKSSELSGGLLEVSRAFRQAYRNLRRLKGRETHLLGGEISHAQFELLVELRGHGRPMAAGELAQVAGLSPASVSQMVDHLVEDGHVKRIRSDEDRRVVEVELSDRGRQSIEPVIEIWRERWRDAFEGVEEADLETAREVLERVARVFEESPTRDE